MNNKLVTTHLLKSHKLLKLLANKRAF